MPGPLFADAAAGPDEQPDEQDEGAGVVPAPDDPEGAVPHGPPAPREEREPSEASPPEAGSGHAAGGDASAIVGTLATVAGRRRPARYGLLVQFESRPDDPELGRLVDSTIWINEAHPAYTRATASRSAGYHIALTVALALAPLAVGPAAEHAFLTRFLAHWGGAGAATHAAKRRRRRKRR